MAPLVSTFAPAGNYPSGLKKLQDGCPTERQLLRDLPAGLTGFVCRNDVGAQSVGYPSSLTGRAASGASCIACVSSCTSVTNVFDQKRSRATKESGSDQARWRIAQRSAISISGTFANEQRYVGSDSPSQTTRPPRVRA